MQKNKEAGDLNMAGLASSKTSKLRGLENWYRKFEQAAKWRICYL